MYSLAGHYNKVVGKADDQPHDSKGRIFPYWQVY
jgi:hypothetical protein